MLFNTFTWLALFFMISPRSTIAGTVFSLPKHQVEEIQESRSDSHLLDRRQSTNASGFAIVTGIQGTGIQPRLEIRQLERNADQWNLYLLGLMRFKAMNETEKLSFYQIAGKASFTGQVAEKQH